MGNGRFSATGKEDMTGQSQEKMLESDNSERREVNQNARI